MTSLGISPTFPSLLIPPNPSFTSPENTPRGGILLNARRESDPPSPVSPLLDPPSPDNRRSSEPDSPRTPVSPIVDLPPSSAESSKAVPARIRFAPLPDPRRPRSLSAGRAEGWSGTAEEDSALELKGTEVEYDVADEDEAVDDEETEDGDERRRSRSWSKTMTMGIPMGSTWKGTKKLLGMSNEKDSYTDGAPLKKSSSTGGFIGSSPFRTTIETKRRESMQGPAGATLPIVKPDLGHRRNSSLEPSAPSPLSSSPQPVRMLNGRVYGGRRASEAAEREKRLREQNEPAFVEWGNAKQGGLGTAPKSKSLLGDDDDGSGMEWVKRRREERQRKAEADKQAAETAGGSDKGDRSDGTTSPDTAASTSLVTPATSNSALPPTPIIQVSEYASPGLHKSHTPDPISQLSSSAPKRLEEQDREHITQAIQVPQRQAGGRDVFDDSSYSDRGHGAVSDQEDDDEEDGDEEDEEEDDGDFDDDDEDEEDIRTTSSAAGVEKVSRHKD